MTFSPVLWALQRDLTTNILAHSGDIGKCASQITRQLREILAPRIVAILQTIPTGGFHLIDVCPERKKDLFADERIRRLVETFRDVQEAIVVKPGPDEAGRLLTDLGMKDSFLVPLLDGKESLGVLLLLDLMDPKGVDEILDTLKDISGLLSLILKNAFLYKNLETLVEQRTKALKASEARHSLVLETAMDGFWMVDNRGSLVEVNESYCLMSGYTKSELQGMSISTLEAAESAEEVASHVRKILSTGKDFFETWHRRKDGSHFPIEASVQVSPFQEGLMFAFIRDISKRKKVEEEKARLESQLQQSQKMESVGRLAGGVAHDFNNMLGVILGQVELSLNDVNPEEPLYNGLLQIRKAAKRSADLTRQLLAFARKQTIQPKVMNLNETVTSMISMLQRLIGENIQLSWIPGAEAGAVRMDPGQIDQMLTNLCVNARDAIADVGKITIETGKATFDASTCGLLEGVKPGEFALIAVTDDGKGMSKETLSHIFEPFFTTKEIGKGTGLGLATVFGIAKQNQGFIDVSSEPGKGTTFRIYIPSSTGQNEGTDTNQQKPIPSQGAETVFLVEDEDELLQMTKKMLQKLGYNVLTADTPSSALRLAKEHTGTFDLLMTDVILPEMNGRELASRIQALIPGLPVLFMSGYTSDVIAHHGVLEEGAHFIGKPFSVAEVAEKVRAALTKKRSRTGSS